MPTPNDENARDDAVDHARGFTRISDELGDLAGDDLAWRTIASASLDYGMALLDKDGRIARWSPGAEKMTGHAARDITGRTFAALFPSDVTPQSSPSQLLASALDEGRSEYEGHLVRRDTTRYWANLVLAPVLGEAGLLRGFAMILRDFGARRAREERTRQSEERFRILVEQVKDYAIFLLDTDGVVVSWNQGAQRIKGYDAGEIIGEHFSRFYLPEDIANGKPEWELRVARAEGRVEDEGWRLRRDGSTFWANIVITALHNRDGSLRGFAKVTRDMTERKRIEALEEAERRTNEFLAMLAHELRNPLAPIRNAVGVLRARAVDDPHIRRTRDVIDRQVTHLARLVDDLLDVSRITTGKITLHRERVELSDVFVRAIDETKPLIDQRRQRLELRLPGRPVHIQGDRVRLVQIVTNLLANAAKFTPEGGFIGLSASVHDQRVEVRVRDDGVGISAELLPRVFDLFTQGDRSLDHSGGGLGIGLTLVKRLVLLHDGTVEARSAGLGQGSEFIVTLPLDEGSEHGAGANDDDAGDETRPPRTIQVLVVDDNRDSAESMVMLLEAWGYTVLSAGDGTSALKIAAEVRPEVVLLDIGLPGMDGFEVAERLRQAYGEGRPVLIAVTGYGQADDRRRTTEAGFHHHLIKPVEFDALRRILESL